MTRIRVYPYKQGSRSARILADALGGRVLKLEGSRFRAKPGDAIINWGASFFPFRGLNSGESTSHAGNKLQSFLDLQAGDVRIPEFWENADEIPDDAFPIVCRTILRGHSGAGIVIAESREELVRAPLYVRYIPKQDEYRIHVMGDEVISVQRKARRLEKENPNWRVRNHANGFNFVRDGVESPADVLDQARRSIIALGLDFGAVDVIWNERRQSAYVLEVNTAPGLEGQTVIDYRDAFIRRIQNV